MNAAELDFAERLLIRIPSWAREPSEVAILRVFASDDPSTVAVHPSGV